ncbi:Protein suppressor of hairy wing, partial [Stegodyphus mimosarum]
MHSTKILSPIKKQDGKAVHQMKKTSPAKLEDRKDDLIGMKLKNLKPQLAQSKVKIKSINKHETMLQKNISILEARTVLKISEKRKSEKSVNVDGKRLKCESDPDVGSKSMNFSISNVKKQNKSKIVYPKTHANYVCKFCCRRFHSVDLLREHAASHGNKPSHVCYLCNHQAGTFSALMTHYLKHSGTKGAKVENIYAKSRADFCNIQFNISSRPKSAVRCTHCRSSFPSREKLDSHNCPIALQKKEYNCAYCGHISSSVDEYRNHVQSHSVTPFKCSYCNFKLQTKKQLDKHYDVCKKRPKPKSITLQCDKCSVQCKSKKEFNLHIKTCDKPSDNVPQDLHCFQCNAKLKTKALYENHILTCKVDTKKEKSNTNL